MWCQYSSGLMVEWPEAGTPVRLVVKTWAGETSHEGLSLPPAGPKLVTMKLVNGYNISYPEVVIQQVEILESVPMEEEEIVAAKRRNAALQLAHDGPDLGMLPVE